MQLAAPHARFAWQRSLSAATAMALLLVGILPALHSHGAEHGHEHHHDGDVETCKDAVPAVPLAAQNIETVESEHHEPCGLCAKILSSASPEQALTLLYEELVVGQATDGLQTLPPAQPGRHGASRAPPAA